MKIEVGMLVRIIRAGRADSPYIGHIGKVLSKSEVFPGHWYVEGATRLSSDPTRKTSWETSYLQPINPDHEPCEEEFADQLQQWLKGGVRA